MLTPGNKALCAMTPRKVHGESEGARQGCAAWSGFREICSAEESVDDHLPRLHLSFGEANSNQTGTIEKKMSR